MNLRGLTSKYLKKLKKQSWIVKCSDWLVVLVVLHYTRFTKTILKDGIKKLLELKTEESLVVIDLKNLDTLMAKSDSLHPVFFTAKCLFQIKRKDMSVEKDTTRILLNKEMNILKTEDYNRVVSKLYTPLSGFKVGKE